MQEWPYPPDCSHCGGRIGMWEPVLTEPNPQTEATTWLRLCEQGAQVEDLWHESCMRLE
jgi:hypothetical protein